MHTLSDLFMHILSDFIVYFLFIYLGIIVTTQVLHTYVLAKCIELGAEKERIKEIQKGGRINFIRFCITALLLYVFYFI